MAKPTVSIAGVDYDRTRAIFDGTIGIDGCETICIAMSPEKAFHRAFRYQEFDITELSLSNTMKLVAKGAYPYLGIPVFPSRLFRHSSIYIRTDRGIDRLQALRGKVVGVPEYQVTAAVWIRGILRDEYGVRAADVKWRGGGLVQPVREPRGTAQAAAGNRMAADPGRRDAVAASRQRPDRCDDSALAPFCFGRNPKVQRFFPDYCAASADRSI